MEHRDSLVQATTIKECPKIENQLTFFEKHKREFMLPKITLPHVDLGTIALSTYQNIETFEHVPVVASVHRYIFQSISHSYKFHLCRKLEKDMDQALQGK